MINLAAAVLAGGDSKRMGEDKAFLKLGSDRLIDIIVGKLSKIFPEIIVVTDKPHLIAHLPVRIVEDVYKDTEKNSLRGIHAALTAANNQSCFIMACDMPFISTSLIAYMSAYALDYDLVTPKLDGYYQPMFSFYNKTSLPVITAALESKDYKIHALYEKFHTRVINEDEVDTHDPRRLSFVNINSPEVYRWAKKNKDTLMA